MWSSVISRRSFFEFHASCNVTLVSFHVTDVACFNVKTALMFQKTRNKQSETKRKQKKFKVQCL